MQIALFAVDGMSDSGYTLVLDVLTSANLLAARAGLAGRAPFVVDTYALSDQVLTGYGMTLPTTRWARIDDRPPDVVVAPSLGLVTAEDVIATTREHAILPGIRDLHEQGVAFAAACSGTFFLAEAGLLDGRPATTSWWLAAAFRAQFPSVRLDEAQALVVSGDITTAGAALAHVDMALSLVRRVNPQLCDLVASHLAVGNRPNQSAVAMPSVLATSDPVLNAFDRFVRDHLDEPITIGDAAAAIGVSTRTLQRLTADALGSPPIRFIQNVRLDHAISLLRTTDRSLTAVAQAVGYGDGSTLRSLIRRHRGITVTELRRRRVSPAAAATSTGRRR